MADIAQFLTYDMSDEQILTLNTGRKKELEFVLKVIEENKKRGRSLQHILLNGPRGIGKSFFLRLVQIEVKQRGLGQMLLLHEEQHNIHQPADLLREINARLGGTKSEAIGAWNSQGREAWNRQTQDLNDFLSADNISDLIIGIENIDMLLNTGGAFAKKADQFLLREFLTHQRRCMFLATTLYPDLDVEYGKAFFHTFAKHELAPWTAPHHEAYLRKRAGQKNLELEPASFPQIKALSRFTGGHPRIAVIMADVIEQEKLESAADTLHRTLDKLTPFYQDLMARMPQKSRLLFDALIRGGEPCSQSDLAKRVGTTQNVIARSFGWLVDNAYLRVDKPPKEKKRLYSVRDRLFAHNYKMRHLLQGSSKGVLAIMAEFLTQFYSSHQLTQKAAEFISRGQGEPGRDLLHLVLDQSGLRADKLINKNDLSKLLQTAKLATAETIECPQNYKDAQALLLKFKEMLAACKNAPKEIDTRAFADRLFGSFSLSLEEKIAIAKKLILAGEPAKGKWIKLETIFTKEFHKLMAIMGNSGRLLSETLSSGRFIPQMLDEKTLAAIENKDPDLHALIVVFWDMFPPGSKPIENISFDWRLEAPVKEFDPQIKIKANRRLLDIAIDADDIKAQGIHLKIIGSSRLINGRHEEAIKVHRQAAALREKEGVQGGKTERGRRGKTG